MGPVRLGVGSEWLLDGRAWRVTRQLAPDRFVAQDAKFLVEREFNRDEILAHYADGKLRLASEQVTELSAKSRKPNARTYHDLNHREKQLVQRRWRVIQPLTKLGRTPCQQDFSQRADQLKRQGRPCSARTIRRYWRAWHDAGNDRMALLPRTRRSGAPGRSRCHGLLERYPQLKQMTEDAVRGVYLTKARRPISAVVRRVLEDLQRTNARLPANRAIPVPREAALSRAIARRVAQMDPWEVDRQRWGRRIADRRHRPTMARRLATRVLERIEIDHSPLKVVVGTEAGPLGQPWITVLIDYYSRLIVGFCLGFEPPSYAVIMEALRHAILPKSYVAEQYPKAQGSWPCYGLPEKLVCDRGPDLTSKDLENAAFQLGIELDFNPPRMPHLKGTVESFFDGLNDQLAATLPGRTFRSWERRADYDPDIGPLLPYEALVEVIHVYLIDVYSRSKHPTIPNTRLEVWHESAAEYPPFLPAQPDELIVLLSKRVERTLSNRGIELGGMFYMSDELMDLRPQLAANNIESRRLVVRYNPWNLGTIWVLNPVTSQYVRARAVDSALEGMTEYQWRVLKRAIRERFDGPDHLMSLAEGRNRIRDIVEQTIQKPSRKRRVRAARYLKPPTGVQNHPGSGGESSAQFPVGEIPADRTDSPEPEAPCLAENPSEAAELDSHDFQVVDMDDIDVDDWPVDSSDRRCA